MIPPSRTPIWTAIESLDDIDLRRVTRKGQSRVLIIDNRTWTELADLTPADTECLADALYEKAGETPFRLTDIGHFSSGSG